MYASTGPPGMSLIRKNVREAMTKMVISALAIRRSK
jgi:hypothetical protein